MTSHAHSRAAYIAGRRDCPGCRAANAAYQRRRRRTAGYGRPTTDMIDAGPVREHLATLTAAGIGWRRIATLSGVAHSVVYRLTGHRHDRPADRVRPETAAALFAVRVDQLAPKVLVDAAPAWRLVHGMAARGYSMAWIGSQIAGYPVPSLQLGAELCTRQTLDRLRQAAEHAAIHPGPSERARRRAAREGWDAAWLWDGVGDGQDANGTPDEIDEIAVCRLVDGDLTADTVTAAERREAASRLLAAGVGQRPAAVRTGLSQRELRELAAERAA